MMRNMRKHAHAQAGRRAHLPQAACAVHMTRCTTRKGSRCTLTSTSGMKDISGRLVAQPLRRGGEYCLLHAKPFVVRPAVVQASVTVFLEIETTGVDVVRDRIVELAAMHAPADRRLAGGSYSTTVQG